MNIRRSEVPVGGSVRGIACRCQSDLLAFYRSPLPAGEIYTVDSGHLVAFPAGMPFEVSTAGSWKSTILGGEGFVVNLTGPGDIYLQTRSPAALIGWIIPQVPRQSSDS